MLLLKLDIRTNKKNGWYVNWAELLTDDFGYNGLMTGFAANKKLLEHYCKIFNAEHIGILHPYQFAIDEENAKNIMDLYDYEWTDEQI